MFGGAGAESLCTGAKVGYAIEGGAGANLALVNQAQSARTINARDVPFPMVDPYSPVANAGIPVPGYTAWPSRANRLGRRYYGLGSITEGAPGRAAQAIAEAFKKPKGFAGLGFVFDPNSGNVDWLGDVGEPPVYKPPSTGGNFNWDNFFGGLFKTLPGTISAVTGKGDPLNRGTQQYQFPTGIQYAPEGYSYNSSGQLVKDAVGSVTDFISSNPLLVGGAILGAILLFSRPPGRR